MSDPDLDALAKLLEAATRENALPWWRNGDEGRTPRDPSNGWPSGWPTFCTNEREPCEVAAFLVELANAAPELLRLARLGQRVLADVGRIPRKDNGYLGVRVRDAVAAHKAGGR